MRTLHIIMPMAGEGSRFKNAGWTIPKPLISLKNKPLFLRAVDSVKYENVLMKYSFIVRKEHIEKYEIDKKIKSILPNSNIFFVEKTTRGAVETCLVAEKNIADDEAIIVMDCDLEFKSLTLENEIRRVLSQESSIANGGALVSFESSAPRYSYAAVDGNMFAKRTAEKEVISNHALCGAYFFSSGKEFLECAHRLLNQKMEKKEFYTSLLYNFMLEKKERVLVCPMEEYYSYGTPEELQRYQ